MAIFEYGIGGNEIKVDASESIAMIPENRTLIVEQLTSEEAVQPEVVEGLATIEQVFDHYKPQVDIEFENAEGQPIRENFSFHNVGDFSVKKLTEQSNFLSKLNVEKEFWESLQKQLRSNKVLQRALENPDTKEALIASLQSILAELKEAGNE